MAKIKVTDRDDRRLERIVPPSLKGPRRVTQRVRWAIDELESRLAGTQDKPRRKAG